MTKGRRLADGFHLRDSEPGDYWKQSYTTKEEFEAQGSVCTGDRGIPNWEWTIRDPTGALGTVSKHEVEEHPDGTISVSPSILNQTTVDGNPVELYHGFLKLGVWEP